MRDCERGYPKALRGSSAARTRSSPKVNSSAGSEPAVPLWPSVLKALALTAIVVPTAVYVAVPRLLILYSRIRIAQVITSQRRILPKDGSRGVRRNM